eukprot:199680_1
MPYSWCFASFMTLSLLHGAFQLTQSYNADDFPMCFIPTSDHKEEIRWIKWSSCMIPPHKGDNVGCIPKSTRFVGAKRDGQCRRGGRVVDDEKTDKTKCKKMVKKKKLVGKDKVVVVEGRHTICKPLIQFKKNTWIALTTEEETPSTTMCSMVSKRRVPCGVMLPMHHVSELYYGELFLEGFTESLIEHCAKPDLA